MISSVKKWINDTFRKGKDKYTSYHNADVDRAQAGPVSSMTNSNVLVSWTTDGSPQTTERFKEPEDKRIVKKPVEVVNEIMNEIPQFDVSDLDKKIKVVKRRFGIFKEQGLDIRDETIALRYLNARKKFLKVSKKFAWPTTTQEKIDTLLSTYKLMKVGAASYSRNLPHEAVDEIEKWAEAQALINNEKPELSLICDQGGKEQKKDPILLAKSPFGDWYFVLGAWDKEVMYVDDLVYNHK